jgi:hypothetical protein
LEIDKLQFLIFLMGSCLQTVSNVQLGRSVFRILQGPLYFKQFGATSFDFGTHLHQTALSGHSNLFWHKPQAGVQDDSNNKR